MNVRNLVGVAVVWVLSLVGAAVWAQGSDAKIVTKDGKVLQGLPPGSYVGNVIAGENIGFIPVADSLNTPGKISGRFVVKINGKWVDAVPTVGITR